MRYRMDPNRLCTVGRERVAWAVVHDLVAHPLLVLLAYSWPARAFHDWTSSLAWPDARHP